MENSPAHYPRPGFPQHQWNVESSNYYPQPLSEERVRRIKRRSIVSYSIGATACLAIVAIALLRGQIERAVTPYAMDSFIILALMTLVIAATIGGNILGRASGQRMAVVLNITAGATGLLTLSADPNNPVAFILVAFFIVPPFIIISGWGMGKKCKEVQHSLHPGQSAGSPRTPALKTPANRRMSIIAWSSLAFITFPWWSIFVLGSMPGEILTHISPAIIVNMIMIAVAVVGAIAGRRIPNNTMNYTLSFIGTLYASQGLVIIVNSYSNLKPDPALWIPALLLTGVAIFMLMARIKLELPQRK